MATRKNTDPDAALLRAVPLDARAIAKRQTAAEGAGRDVRATRRDAADCEEDYAYVDALLTEQCRMLDAETAMRKSATAPLYGVIKTVEGWFRPLGQARGAAIATCKRLLGDYRLMQRNAEREAQALAAAALDADDGATAIAALTVAAAAAEAPEGRAVASFAWTVDRVCTDLMPADAHATLTIDGVAVPYWLPNVAAFAEVAKAHPSTTDAPPVVQGVVFKLASRIAGRR